MAKLRITYTKSAIGYSKDQKDTIRSLGLRKLNSMALHNDTPSIRGMAFKVRHLVKVEELAEEPAAKPARPAKAPAAKPAKATLAPAAVAEKPAKAEKLSKADDLELIEGIGPKIAAVLKDAGILTFADLAATDTDRLAEILQQESNLRLADPGTWPEQAALAAAGKWDEFHALTEQLKGGRRA